jgi:hypothetical protein
LTGGVVKILERAVEDLPEIIDVYRPARYYQKVQIDLDPIEMHYIEAKSEVMFNGKAITDEMRTLTGLPYGWSQIIRQGAQYAFGIRFLIPTRAAGSDKIKPPSGPVCSSSVAYCFSKHNFDLVKNTADSWTTPGDIARSPLLHYMFTLK